MMTERKYREQRSDPIMKCRKKLFVLWFKLLYITLYPILNLT